MEFSFRRNLGLVAIVLLWGTMAVARGGDGTAPEITVLVYDSAHTSPLVLEQAEREASRILGAAGVEISWLNCPKGIRNTKETCHHSLNSAEFVLHILQTGKASTDFVFGLSFLDENGAGTYCDIFFNRIEEAHRDSGINISRLLGAVAAHELGHLLLGSHAHSNMGIMTPRWVGEALRSMNMGRLLFTREQASRMQVRLRGNNWLASLAETGERR
jgi:hypothetical protein